MEIKLLNSHFLLGSTCLCGGLNLSDRERFIEEIITVVVLVVAIIADIADITEEAVLLHLNNIILE